VSVCSYSELFRALCFVVCRVASESTGQHVLKFCDRLERKANETDQLMHITTGQVCSDLNTNYWAVLWVKKTCVSKIASMLDVLQPALQFLDETRGSGNVSLLTIQPPDVAASPRKFY
jgi:hypothetical protein